MHDVVAHSLSVMVSQAEGGRLMAQRDPSVTVPVLETVARVGQEAMRDMRSLLQALHEDEPPGIKTPQPGLGELPHLLDRVRGAGLSVTYAETGDRLGLGGAGELAAYRVTQEALTNVLKHAGGDGSAQVRLDWQPGRLCLTIRNDPGRETPRPVSGGRGVSGMTERVAVLGGRLTAGPGRGRSVHGQCRDTHARVRRGVVAVTIRVVLADDQDLVRAGLAMIVESQDDLTVVGQAADGAAAIEAVMKTSPDVVLMDVRMPGMDGIQATAEILRYPDAPRVLMLTTLDIDEHSFAALRAGASGFLLKSAQAEDVVAAIRTVHRGDAVIAPTTTRRLLDQVAPTLPGPVRVPPEVARLTDREREIMLEVASGSSNAEIAARLFLSEATVKTHVGRLLSKLGLRDRVQVVVLAYESGLVRPER